MECPLFVRYQSGQHGEDGVRSLGNPATFPQSNQRLHELPAAGLESVAPHSDSQRSQLPAMLGN